MQFKAVVVTGVMVLSFAGCKKSVSEEALAKLGELKTKMCACKDGKCAKAVDAEMEKWGDDMRAKAKDEKPDEATKTKAKALMTDIDTCKDKARAADSAAALDAQMVKLTEFKDRMCACKPGDSECVTKVSDDMTKWSTDMAKNMDASDVSPDAAAMKKMTDVSTAMGDCMSKAMMPPATE
jgi:hypothetical protein